MKEGYSLRHLTSILMISFSIFTLGSTYKSLNMFILFDTNYFIINKNSIGTSINNIIFYIIPFQLMLSLGIGFVYDLFGRKSVILFGFLIVSLGCIATPLTGPELYPYYFITRVIEGCCVVAICYNPLINDFIISKSRPRAFSLSVMAADIGAGTGVIVLFNSIKYLKPHIAFFILATVAFIFLLIHFFLLEERFTKKVPKAKQVEFL